MARDGGAPIERGLTGVVKSGKRAAGRPAGHLAGSKGCQTAESAGAMLVPCVIDSAVKL